MKDLNDLVKRANSLLKTVAHRRPVSGKTSSSYNAVFAKMWETKNLDPLRSGDAIDTYHHRRSALHWGGSRLLARLVVEIDKALEVNDTESLRIATARLHTALQLIEPAFSAIRPFRLVFFLGSDPSLAGIKQKASNRCAQPTARRTSWKNCREIGTSVSGMRHPRTGNTGQRLRCT